METSFEKTDKPAQLTDFRVEAHLPHADLRGRQAAVLRVADHCIIHETLQHLKALEIRIHDRSDLAAVRCSPSRPPLTWVISALPGGL